MTPHIRWMIRSDMPEVLAIERQSFGNPWAEQEFILALRQRNCIGQVAEHNDIIVGFMLYELFKHRLELINLAVLCDSRRQGVGSALIDKLKTKCSAERRHTIVADIPVSNEHSHLFFKANGFLATGLMFDKPNGEEDSYIFEYEHSEAERNAALSRMAAVETPTE